MLQRQGLVFRTSCACERATQCQHVSSRSASPAHFCGCSALPRLRAVATHQKQILDHVYRRRRQLTGKALKIGCSRSRAARFRAAQFRAAQYRTERFSAAAAGAARDRDQTKQEI